MLKRLLGHKPRRRVSKVALERALSEMARGMPDLHWAAVVSVDGVVHTMHDPFGKAEPDRAAAMAAAALSLGERISCELGHGDLTYEVIAGDQRSFITYPIGDALVLALSLPAEAEVGTVIDRLTQSRGRFASALDPGAGE
jgi:predicted regulator of Ras-like GTPase activity (Roadblock/LC7/MglB family)